MEISLSMKKIRLEEIRRSPGKELDDFYSRALIIYDQKILMTLKKD